MTHIAFRPARMLVAAGAVTATASLGSLLLAPGASAATDETWDRLASCESSQVWDINTGNGYYGGLQFSDATWDGYGGEQYAARADLASREQQIAIAEKVLAGQGWGAWPACSSGLGLDAGDAAGTASAPTSEASTSSGGSAGSGGTHTVVPGDTMYSLAEDNGTTIDAIMAANPAVTSPQVIVVGQALTIP